MLTVYKVKEGMNTPHELAVRGTAHVLREGGLALIPTETVYGLAVAVSAFAEEGPWGAASAAPTWERDGEVTVNGAAVPALGSGYRRIFTLKHREVTQTVAWLVAGEEDLDTLGQNVDPRAHVLARAFWPGALTIVVKAAPCVPAFMREADGTVALRTSASPVVSALIKECKSPLACTSANSHGLPAPASFTSVEERVLGGVDIAIDAGDTPCRDASTIVSFVHGELEVIREGALPAAKICAALAGEPGCGGGAAIQTDTHPHR